MKYFFSLIFFFGVINTCFAQDSLYWQKVVYGNNGTTATCVINHQDELFVVGVFSDSLVFDNQKIVGFTSNVGRKSIFISKYSSLDKLMWVKEIAKVNMQFNINGCVIDKKGNLIFSINNVSNFQMYDSKLAVLLPEEIINGSLLMKFNSDGDFIYKIPVYNKYTGENNIGYSGNQGITINKNNDIIITGTLEMDTFAQTKHTCFVGTMPIVYFSKFRYAMFFAKIKENGEVQYIHAITDSAVAAIGFDVVTDNDNNIYVVSYGYTTKGYFDGIPFATMPINGSKINPTIVSKYDKDGNIKFIKLLSCSIGSIFKIYFHKYANKVMCKIPSNTFLDNQILSDSVQPSSYTLDVDGNW